MTDYKTACIFGGTGFIGRQIVRELAKLDIQVKVATRVPERAYFLKPCGTVGQIVPVACNYNDLKSIKAAVKGCDYVVNCIGVLYEKKKGGFEKAHTDIPVSIAKACKSEGVKRFVHVSSLGVDKNTAKYAQTKLAGEKAAKKSFKDVSILRPSVVFGPDDSFFNMFAKMAKISPFLPLIGGGKTQFQPVFVGDVADAVITCLTKSDCSGQTYELGGPDVVTFKEIYKTLFDHTNNPKPLLPLPWGIAKIQGSLMSLMPKPLLTADQVESLKHDNVVSDKALTFEDLGFAPKSMESILPTYLSRYRPGGRFADIKEAS